MLSVINFLRKNLLFNLLRIRAGEEKKFFSMALLMFTILLSQNIIRNIKEAWVVTLIGAQSIVFIKLWIEAPIGVLFIFLYTKLCNKVNLFSVFRYVILFFIGYFLIFLLILIPNMEILHMHPDTVAKYVSMFPHAKWFILLASKWTIVSFYVMGEMVPIIVFPILFWQIPNNTSSVEQSQRFYPSLSFFGQSNLVILSFLVPYLDADDTMLSTCLNYLSIENTLLVKVRILLIIAIFLFMCCISFHKLVHEDLERVNNGQHSLPPLKLGIKATFKLVFSSKYTMQVVMLVLCYSLAINLMEMMWFDKISHYYNFSTEKVMHYHAKLSLCTGVVTLVFSGFGAHIIEFFGWLVGASLTPIIMFITGTTFFVSLILYDHCTIINKIADNNTMLFIILCLVSVQYTLSKGIKYSLFDTTKEMAYVPLPREIKTKGKAAIEVLSINFAKMLGSSVQSIIFIIFPYAQCSDAKFILFTLFIFCILFWITNVKKIGLKYQDIQTQPNTTGTLHEKKKSSHTIF